jgi:hypothetical protein
MNTNIKIIVIVAVVLALGGGYLLMKKNPGTEKALEDVSITAPVLDFSLSPLPKLEISSFNIFGSDLPSDMFSDISVNTDFSYTGSTNLAVPSIQIDASSLIPEAETPSQPSGQSQQENTVNVATCAQFSSVPSCSMTGSGQTLCEQCRAAGF